MGVKAHLSFLATFYRRELSSLMEYRFNFISQTIGMFLNDVLWIFFWFLLFYNFKTINGWSFHEMMFLYSILGMVWGVKAGLFSNSNKLARTIAEGQLDYYLSLPKNVLLHAIAKTGYSAGGELLFGITLSALTFKLEQLPLFLLFIITSTAILVAWDIIVNSITFYVGNFEQAARTASNILLTFSFYPFSVYSGATKFVLLFIIPAGFVTGIPVELLKSFSWKWLAITLSFSLLFSTFAVWFFYKGLRKYESGNVMAMRG
ncbi:ABC-2 family transporter protein [Candidatus Woesearchaeota archaeon]|nr:ABC-2 family transporter protein [Candidatus Woesearchaeota archaeon]